MYSITLKTIPFDIEANWYQELVNFVNQKNYSYIKTNTRECHISKLAKIRTQKHLQQENNRWQTYIWYKSYKNKILTLFHLNLSSAGWFCKYSHKADSRLAPSQWETSLQSNAISHWLGANLKSALYTGPKLDHRCVCKCHTALI